MNDANNNEEFDALVEAYIDGRLSVEEANRLNASIEGSEPARRRYWELTLVHGMLEQGLQNASVKAAAGEQAAVASVKRGIFLEWPGLLAAAAGVVFGVFSASLVWAYNGSHPRPEVRQEIMFESFEGDESRTLSPAFPDRAGKWFGDLSIAAPSKNGLQPERGTSVARFTPAHTRKYSYARYIIDVDDLMLPEVGQVSQLEVKASFASDPMSLPARYQIRLAAFTQAPEEVRAIWNRESVLFDTALQHTARNYVAAPDRQGWKKLRSRVDIPPGTRSLVISLGVAEQGNSPPSGGHYLDAVRVRLISSLAPQG